MNLNATIDWNLSRSTLRVTGGNNTLNGSVDIGGPVSAAVNLGLERISARVNLQGRVAVTARPQLREDWRLTTPDLELGVTLNEASLPLSLPITRMVPFEVVAEIPIIRDIPLIGEIISGIRRVVRTVTRPIEQITTVDISVRGVVQEHLDPEISELRNEIRTDIRNADFLREAAEQAWGSLCLQASLAPDVWLQVRPLYARAAQPQITEEGILLQLGIDAETQVSTSDTTPNAQTCSFPDTLSIEALRPANIEINLPARLDYEVLQRALSDHLVGQTFGDLVSVIVDDVVQVRAAGKSLLVQINVTLRTSGWWSTQAAGTLYVLAEPYLDAESQRLRFLDVSLETASRNALVAAVGEASEPLVENLIEGYDYDLSSTYAELRNTANAALGALSSDDLVLDGGLEDVRFARLDVGTQYLRLLATARGQITATIARIP